MQVRARSGNAGLGAQGSPQLGEKGQGLRSAAQGSKFKAGQDEGEWMRYKAGQARAGRGRAGQGFPRQCRSSSTAQGGARSGKLG